MRKTYSIIGSSGELERYDDAFAEQTPALAEDALRAEQEIMKRKDAIEQSFLELAFLLDAFEHNQYYLGRGFETFSAWVDSVEVNIGKRVALDLLRIAREVMPALREDGRSLEQAVQTLADAKISKTRALLPLLSEGMHEEFIDLMERAPEMTLRDVNREVRMLRNPDDEDADLMPAVFKAYVKAGEKTTRYRIVAIDGQTVTDVGVLNIPTKYASRWGERFGRFIEYEMENL